MQQLSIKTTTRKKEIDGTKQEGKIPAVLYGKDINNVILWVDRKDFNKVYREAGESSLVDLVIEDGKKQEPQKVLIYDLQTDPLTDEFIHIDFYCVKMDEEIEAMVALNFVGESLAVKELGGVLVKTTDEVEARCLPGDLIKQIDVDITVLKTFEDHIYIKDLEIPEKVKLNADKNTLVATVSAPRKQEELEELDKEVEGDITQVEGMEKEEEKEEEEKEGDDNKKEQQQKEEEKKAE